MSTSSILSAIQKLRYLLSREEKIKWLGIVFFAVMTSFLEVVAASIIVIFAQGLNQPEVGNQYLSKIGFASDLSAGRVIFYIAIAVGIVYLIKNTVAAVEVFYQNFSIQGMSYKFKNKLLQRYARADYAFYLTRNSSFWIQVISEDAEQMFSTGMIAIASVLSEGTIFFFLLGMIIYLNPSLAFIIFGIGSITALGITKNLLPRFYQFGQKIQEAVLLSHQNLTQFFHAFKEIILFGKKRTFIESYQAYSRKRSQIQAIHTSINTLPRMIIEVLFVELFVITIAFLCFEQESPVQMIGILGGYLYAGFRLMPGLNRIINQLNTFKSVIPSIERIYHEYKTVTEKDNYLNTPELHFKESITLQNVCFKYLGTKKNIINYLSLKIKKGECIGIIGETGSGKSTLVDLILGLLKPYQGTILIDDIYPVHSYQWHQKIGYVSQSIYLIDDTIEANIAFGEQEIDYRRLNEAIDSAQLRKFIDKLPNNAKTVTGERGVRLSGGERQRIAIARALYHNPEVLIFDEATSALDYETEARLIETIYRVSQNRTVIMVAHRLTTLEKCDRIIEIKNGRVMES